MPAWSVLKYGQRCKIVIDGSWDCSAQGTVPKAAPVGKAKPAKLLKRTHIIESTYGANKTASIRLQQNALAANAPQPIFTLMCWVPGNMA
jgi:hypothetical protein